MSGGRWVATCARGLEEIVESELSALGLEPVEREVGGVTFVAGLEGVVRACWRLRSASRVLSELASFPAPDDESLYAAVRAQIAAPPTGPLSLSALATPEHSFAISATSTRSRLRDTRWIALKTKDALADAQRARWGRRADVDRVAPDLALRVRLLGDRASLLLDLVGTPLDRRGYRLASTAAPLREQLAAGALLGSGWNGRGPVVDLMCGSGTLLAEAGAIALGLAPNRLRQDWALDRLEPFRGLLRQVRAEAIPAPDPEVRLHGSDLDPEALAAAATNLDAAGLGDHFQLTRGDAFALPPPPGGPGLLALNPPYGDRIEEAPDQWRRLGDLLKQRYRGWKAVLVTGDPSLGKHLGLRPTRRIPVWNGPLEARILVLDLW